MDRWYIFVAQNNVWIEGEIMLFQTVGNELNPVILFGLTSNLVTLL